MIEAEILKFQSQFLEIFQAQRKALELKPTSVLINLQYRADEMRWNKNYSLRVSGEVNYSAATLILEKRK